MPAAQHCTLNHFVEGNAPGWLTVQLREEGYDSQLREEGYDMSATQFCDQLAICYHHELSGLPASCDSCGAPFSLQHGLDCAKGGLVKKCCNDLHDTDARVAVVAWGGVPVEPILVPENDKRQLMLHQAD